MKVLLSAYACTPDRGSEPGAGWAWTLAAARQHQITLLTRVKNVDRLRQAAAEGGLDNLTVVGIDLPGWLMRLKHGHLTTVAYYSLWQVIAGLTARRLARNGQFDLMHHITFASDSLPVGLTLVRHVPLVWGPVGGGSNIPWEAVSLIGVGGYLRDVRRRVVSLPPRHIFGKGAARRSTVVITQNLDAALRLRKFDPIVRPNVALQTHPDYPRTSTGTNAIYVGRLVRWKAAEVAIRAIARTRDWSLSLCGDGPDHRRLERLAISLGVQDRVIFRGQLPRNETMDLVRRADVLLAPSVREAAGWAVAEAIALGTPVLAADAAGHSVILNHDSRSLVPVDRHMHESIARRLSSRTFAVPENMWTPQDLAAFVDSVYRAAAEKAPRSPTRRRA